MHSFIFLTSGSNWESFVLQAYRVDKLSHLLMLPLSMIGIFVLMSMVTALCSATLYSLSYALLHCATSCSLCYLVLSALRCALCSTLCPLCYALPSALRSALCATLCPLCYALRSALPLAHFCSTLCSLPLAHLCALFLVRSA